MMVRVWRGLWMLLCVVVLAFPAQAADKRNWKALEKDDVHDPQGPSLQDLQHPSEALKTLPSDGAGNQVDWVNALRNGFIQPRTNILPETQVNVLDLDLIYSNTGDQPFVRFPHRPHTEWLDCVNCHEEIFKTKFNGSGIKMSLILEGKFCGQCHGAVAFPLTECKRCHSVSPDTFRGQFGAQGPVPAQSAPAAGKSSPSAPDGKQTPNATPPKK
ncbi:MAG: hypothetical protein HQM00_05345 [Magnetococcales bacterium]|nr:hypothetical protein [Magnetococcales bacterium]